MKHFNKMAPGLNGAIYTLLIYISFSEMKDWEYKQRSNTLYIFCQTRQTLILYRNNSYELDSNEWKGRLPPSTITCEHKPIWNVIFARLGVT